MITNDQHNEYVDHAAADTPRPERVTLAYTERSYGVPGDGIHWRGRWYSEASVKRILTAREKALREQIARDIQAAKPPHVLRNYTPVNAAYDDAARIAGGETR